MKIKWISIAASSLLIIGCSNIAGNGSTPFAQACEFSVPNAETTAIFTNDPSCGKTLSDLASITDTYWIPVNLIPPTNSPICQVTNTKHMGVTVWDSGDWTYSNELCDFLEMDGFSPM